MCVLLLLALCFGGVWISAWTLSFVVIKSDREDLPVCLVIIDHGNDTKDPQLESQIESIQHLQKFYNSSANIRAQCVWLANKAVFGASAVNSQYYIKRITCTLQSRRRINEIWQAMGRLAKVTISYVLRILCIIWTSSPKDSNQTLATAKNM